MFSALFVVVSGVGGRASFVVCCSFVRYGRVSVVVVLRVKGCTPPSPPQGSSTPARGVPPNPQRANCSRPLHEEERKRLPSLLWPCSLLLVFWSGEGLDPVRFCFSLKL